MVVVVGVPVVAPMVVTVHVYYALSSRANRWS